MINQQKMNFDFDPIQENNEVYVTANPDKGIFSMLNAYYEFSRFSGKLSLATADHEFLFTIGSKTATVDGKSVELSKEISSTDGLPVLPLKFLLDNMGYKYTVDGKTISVATIDEKYIEAMKNRIPYQYEFAVPGDAEGWKPGNASISVVDEALSGTAIPQSAAAFPAYDPALTSPDFNISASLYTKIVVGLKYEYQPADAKDSACVYFKTMESGSLDEKKTVHVEHIKSTTDGEFVEYTFDMTTNPLWTGTVTGIRFDPLNHAGSFSIDYIRFIKDPNAKVDTTTTTAATDVSKGNITDTLINGDAEDVSKVAFSSDNANTTIIEDPDKAGNHVYNIDSKKPGQNWLYARQDVKFVAGKTYIVEFDVKVTGTNDGSKVVKDASINLNPVYADTPRNDHNVEVAKISTDTGWYHVTKEITINAASTDRSKDQFTIYANPIGELTVNYMLDNLKITAK